MLVPSTTDFAGHSRHSLHYHRSLLGTKRTANELEDIDNGLTTAVRASKRRNTAKSMEIHISSPVPSTRSSSAMSKNAAPFEYASLDKATSHRESEQRRRDKVNRNLQDLKDLIPVITNNKQRRIDKATTISLAVDYINQLHSTISRLEDEAQVARSLNAMRDSLTSPHISTPSDNNPFAVQYSDASGRNMQSSSEVTVSRGSSNKARLSNADVGAIQSLLSAAPDVSLTPRQNGPRSNSLGDADLLEAFYDDEEMIRFLNPY